MFEKLTPEANELLDRAKKEARSKGRARVQPVDLLIALLDERGGAIAKLLQAGRVSRDEIRREVESPTVGASPGTDATMVTLSNEVLRVLELAVSEAREGGHDLVTVDHLLLGLARLESPRLSSVLARAGFTVEAIRPLIGPPRPEVITDRRPGPRAETAEDLRWKLQKILEKFAADAGKKDILDVPGIIESVSSPLSLRDLEKKGFKKVKVLRDSDINQLIFKAVEKALAEHSNVLGPEEKLRIAAEAKAEHDRQQKQLEEIQEKQDALASANVQLEKKLAEVNGRIREERNKIIAERAALERERAHLVEAFGCPAGHGPMDRVLRDGVRLAVCGECLSTFFLPGELEALVKRLSELSPDALHRFLDPEEGAS